jgi:hypothetical protein
MRSILAPTIHRPIRDPMLASLVRNAEAPGPEPERFLFVYVHDLPPEPHSLGTTHWYDPAALPSVLGELHVRISWEIRPVGS